MTDTTNGHRALPWRSEGYRVFDADGIEVANTFTPELALGSAKAVAKDIATAVNAYYGGEAAMADADKAETRIAEHTEEVYRLHSLFAKALAKAHNEDQEEISALRKRAEAAEDSLKRAEARLNLFLRYHNEDQEEISALRERAEDAEARVRELEKTHAPDTFTAPDGRVFRVGQRVWHTNWEDFATIKGPGISAVFGFGIPVRREERIEKSWPDSRYLRRVWDGLEEPDVPVGTVLRDSYGCYLERLSGTPWATRWELRDDKGDLVDNDEWVNLDGEQFRPYVEVLPGDDE